jgi:hypothetical protein
MGTLHSKFNHSGMVVNGITLAYPAILTQDLQEPMSMSDAYFIWDDSRLPNGEILEDGTILIQE